MAKVFDLANIFEFNILYNKPYFQQVASEVVNHISSSQIRERSYRTGK